MPCAPSTQRCQRPLPPSPPRCWSTSSRRRPARGVHRRPAPVRRASAHPPLPRPRLPSPTAVTAAVGRLGRPRQPVPVVDLRKLLKACRDGTPASCGIPSRQLRDAALTRRMPEPGGDAPRRGHRVDRRQHRPGLRRRRRDRQKPRPARDPLRPPHRAGVNPLSAGLSAAPAGNAHRRSVAQPHGALTNNGLGPVLERPASSRASPASTRTRCGTPPRTGGWANPAATRDQPYGP